MDAAALEESVQVALFDAPAGLTAERVGDQLAVAYPAPHRLAGDLEPFGDLLDREPSLVHQLSPLGASRSLAQKPSASTWQPDIFGGAGIQRQPGKDRADDLRQAADEMRDSGSSDLFDAAAASDETQPAAVVTFHVPVSGWPTMAELIARSIALGGDPFGPQSDDVEYGAWCAFCGNRAAVCRCDPVNGVTSVTISSSDPRSIRAVEIAAEAGQWLRCRTADGRAAFGVPASARARRVATTSSTVKAAPARTSSATV